MVVRNSLRPDRVKPPGGKDVCMRSEQTLVRGRAGRGASHAQWWERPRGSHQGGESACRGAGDPDKGVAVVSDTACVTA